ncbi:Yih1p [Sugiyamaella lignohabitans]|uniref:Yih1p n=1 Tax=Sugiyamaella lignohabitans TaxID=796027 RepID=A0A167E640_9ASCO|nr:Yih1p [Sugiyamaella lignohabitans]ANB13689.1 Yih1p [Sugiyamaella lignohabitans]
MSNRSMSEIENEVEAINSIYEGCMSEWAPSIYDVHIPDSSVVVRLSFPSVYPEKAPAVMAVVKGRQELSPQLESLISSLFVVGEVIVFDFIESCREFLEQEGEGPDGADSGSYIDSPEASDVANGRDTGVDPTSSWIASEPVTDRKSLFIARVCRVESAQEAYDNIALLKTDKKISKATHNITAYRIKRSDGVSVQDCDDDGEDAAGGRLMHLLTLTDSWNVVVCVSRWYGGIKLGPDRFKHINSTARDALVKGGFISISKNSSKKH